VNELVQPNVSAEQVVEELLVIYGDKQLSALLFICA
jgi:hypothetical protein